MYMCYVFETAYVFFNNVYTLYTHNTWMYVCTYQKDIFYIIIALSLDQKSQHKKSETTFTHVTVHTSYGTWITRMLHVVHTHANVHRLTEPNLLRISPYMSCAWHTTNERD